MSKSKMIVISGCSGVGKNTVLGIMMKKRDDLLFSVSATTRQPRPDEIDGVHYYFVTREQFEEMIAKGEFLEYDAHNTYYYGTPRAQAVEKMEKGYVLLDIEPKGAAQVRKAMPEAKLIFIMPPSMEELERRLRSRGDTPEDQILIRLDRAKWEMAQTPHYDYVVINDQVDTCADEIVNIVAKLAD